MRPLFLLLFAATAYAADPAPVVFPDSAVPVAPVVPPKPPAPPKPKPPAIPVLTLDTLYVVDYPGDAISLASPVGVVKITVEAGPVKIKGRFADGKGVETRTFTGKTVITVEALTSGRAELIVIPVGVTNENQIGRKLVDSLTAPLPPPQPPKPPAPPQPAAPIAGEGFKVLIVYDKKDTTGLTKGQQEAIFGTPIREWLELYLLTLLT